MSIRYQSDTFMLDRYLIDVDPRVFAIWIEILAVEAAAEYWSQGLLLLTLCVLNFSEGT